jgi:predicted transposase YbfD/YdcC
VGPIAEKVNRAGSATRAPNSYGLGAENGLKGAIVSIATDAAIANAITEQGADYLFPGELRLPAPACLLRAETRVESARRLRSETRYFISSRALAAAEAAATVRAHWGIENRLHWVLDVTFGDDQSRLRKGHGARNMATVPPLRPQPRARRNDRRSIKSRRKIAGWSTSYLQSLLSSASL